jgi:hypothetical protein
MCKCVKALGEVIHPGNDELWVDYVNSEGKSKPVFLKMDIKKIVKGIKNTLTTWKKYGHLFFIGDGKCNSKTDKKNATVGGKNKNTIKPKNNKTKKQ